jgi:cation:H+ antiporter
MIPVILYLPLFLLGVILLWKGSDALVEGTSKTAFHFGISSLIISVIIVGFGTSAPEFAISIGAAIQNNSDISLGNVIGSCIANLFLVLGIASLIRPIKIKKPVIKREFLIMFSATLILVIASYFGFLDEYRYIGGIIFLIIFTIFVCFFVICAKNERIKQDRDKEDKIQKHFIFIILGIIGVIIGAWLLIESAIVIADFLGIPTFIIALSLVAIGTSIPELVVSSMASYKKESDIAVGNVLGSNVFNILLILGFAALFIPLKASDYVNHLFILLIYTIAMFPILNFGASISRSKGAIMIILFSLYIWYIFFSPW